jgi:FlaA1/EpsC-like NDP-sugar epimerase
MTPDLKTIRRFFTARKIAPKWAIFLLDLFICVSAIVYANYLRFNAFDTVIINDLKIQILTITITSSLFFFIFKTYEGIIRYSGINEAIRCISVIFYSFVFLAILNFLLNLFRYDYLIPTSVLIIYFFTTAFAIFGYRFFVKALFHLQYTQSQNIKNVLVYGAELNGSLLKSTIEHASGEQYKVIAFIEDDINHIGKSIDNIKIYSFAQIKDLVKEWNIKQLFFAKQDMDLYHKNNIVDFCLEADIQVKNLPPVKEWIQGSLTTSQIQNVRIDDLLGRPAIRLANDNVRKNLADKTILVTGAAGSIGSEIVRQLIRIDTKSLILCDQSETGLFELEYELLQKEDVNCQHLKIYLGDIRDKKSMYNLFEQYNPDIVFHAAAYKHVPLMEMHPSQAIRNNLGGTKNVADLAEKFGVERFIFVSTDKAINPTNVMGASKRIAEMYIQALQNKKDYVHDIFDGLHGYQMRASKTKFITTRFGNVLGSSGSVIPRFKEQIASGGPITVTHPDIIRYFMTIPEASALVLEAAAMGNGGEIFLFDMGEAVKIVDLAKKMIKLAGLTPGKDIAIEFTGLRPGEKLYEELLNKQEEVIPTHNKKILAAKVVQQGYNIVSNHVDDLLLLADANDDNNVVRLMKQILPEYISRNSVYEILDKEKAVYSIDSDVDSSKIIQSKVG